MLAGAALSFSVSSCVCQSWATVKSTLQEDNTKREGPKTRDVSNVTSKEDMILIPGGKFRLGTSPSQRKQLVKDYGLNPDLFEIQVEKTVELRPFWIDRHEITNRQYNLFVKETGHRRPIAWVDHGDPNGHDDYPVTGVDYEDALAYAQWAGKRLPREEEWEAASRSADGRLWVWGSEWKKGLCKMDDSSGGPMAASPAPIGAYPMDRSVYGVMDMAGNVLEWVEAALPQSMQNTAMTKGGSFANAAPYLFLCANRNAQPKGNGKVGYIGFRCAKDTAPNDGRQQRPPGQQRKIALASAPSTPVARSSTRLNRTRPVQILPIYDLDPARKTHGNDMAIYLSRKHPRDEVLKQAVPWRVEIHAPYLPDDRFACFFENHFQGRKVMQQADFSQDFTQAELKTVISGYMEVYIKLEGGPDYIDIVYDLKNASHQEISRGQETCFQTLWAPNFRDHDGTRTLISTDQGLKPITEIRRRVWERLWTQDFDRQKKMAPFSYERPGSGPRVEGDFVMITSRDGKWLVAPTALSDSPIRLFNNREYSCLHCNPLSALKPGESKRIKQRIYFLYGSPEDLVKRHKLDFEREKQQENRSRSGQ